MGTQGGYLRRLPGQCEHKLPTSCVLTSTRDCCACEDQRAHSASYTVYVDGHGLLPWGTRWQSYCWPCKEYWDNRTGRGAIPPSQTRVPEIPDQTLFLQRWYQFHRERRVNNHEPWQDVDPGRLPRTVQEIQHGQGASQYELYIDTLQLESFREATRTAQPSVGLDSTLDALLDEASDDENALAGSESVHRSGYRSAAPARNWLSRRPADNGAPPTAGYPRAAGASLAEFLGSILSIMSEPDSDVESAQPVTASRSPAESSTALTEEHIAPQSNQHDYEAESVEGLLDHIAFEAPQSAIIRECRVDIQRMRDELSILHALRDDIRRSTGSSNIAVRRETLFRIREDLRAERSQLLYEVLHQIQRTVVAELEDGTQALISAFDRMSSRLRTATLSLQGLLEGRSNPAGRSRNHSQELDSITRPEFVPDEQMLERWSPNTTSRSPNHPQGLDSITRPEPVPDEQMLVRLECGICLQQIANVVCVPCGHVVMCEWCAEVHIPLRPGSNNSPLNSATCPTCRARVRQRVKLFI